ncbi:MAG: efflux RND transporter periplasmic adaptor subunit [Desulfobacteraceae bacterium]|nr:efflux RND transporter periplasmic adaptor subunit [Desulfobacteraceae bacterium]
MEKLAKIKPFIFWIAALALVGFLAKRALFTPPQVSLVRLARRDLTAQVYGNGTVEAKVVVGVSSRITGRITQVLADQGDRVKAGQLLARLEDDDFAAQVAQAQAELSRARAETRAAEAGLNQAKASLRLAAKNAQRFRALVKDDLVSRQEAEQYDTADAVARDEAARRQSELEASRMAEAAARSAVALAASRLADTRILAPQDGIIVSRDLEQGGTVAPGLSIFTLADPALVWVKANVDEAMLPGVAVGRPATISLRSEPGRDFPGQVARLGRQSDRVTEELEVDVAFTPALPGFRLGEQADVLIVSASKDGALALPSATVNSRGGKRGVWRVQGDGRILFTPVVCGIEDRAGFTEIVSGLPADVPVALAPAPAMAKFQDGLKVRVK